VEEMKSETTEALTGVTKETLSAFVEAPETCFIRIVLNEQ
jgi:hypothetical protein